jgi:ribonuclease HII
MLPPSRTILAREAGLYAMERALQRRGFTHVAGADEAGRGACAGPLVAAAAILPHGRRGEIDGLNDSKLLTATARDRIYDIVIKKALAYSVVIIPAADIDRRGLHVCNVAAMRRAFASLSERPDYALTDGFKVDGLGVPGLAVWKGDQVAACIAAASVLAKVTRDRIMKTSRRSGRNTVFPTTRGTRLRSTRRHSPRTGPVPNIGCHMPTSLRLPRCRRHGVPSAWRPARAGQGRRRWARMSVAGKHELREGNGLCGGMGSAMGPAVMTVAGLECDER